MAQAQDWFAGLKLTPRQQEIARRVLKEISERLGFLLEVGLDYLTLERPTSTLAGGEAQRIRLATQIGSKLSGVLYILDEPSIGLHPRDTQRLLSTLKVLRDLGNTVIVVEHDPDTILAADYVVDMGPGAGRHGGEVVFGGPPEELVARSQSLTGLYLSGRREIHRPGPAPTGQGLAQSHRGHGAQPQGRERGFPPGSADLHHRGLRLREEHPDHGHPVPGPEARNSTGPASRRRRMTVSRASSSWTR